MVSLLAVVSLPGVVSLLGVPNGVHRSLILLVTGVYGSCFY